MASAGSIRTAARWGLLLLAVALGFGGTWAGLKGASAQTQGGQMVSDCEGATRAVESDCSFGDGQEFTVAVQVPDAPGDGYWGFQSKLRWNNDIIEYQPTADPADEPVWPSCSIPARTDNRAGGQDVQVDDSLLFGCVPFPIQVSNYEGPVFLFTFVCAASGSSDLTLVAREGDSQLGSHFVDANLAPIDPSFENARIACGGPEVDRPEPEIVAGNVTPFPEDGTPQPQQATNTPSGPTATPGGPTATTGPTTQPTAVASDEDGDGGGLPVWAWVLIGVGVVAAAGGGGYLLWQRMRQTGGGTPGGVAGAGGGPSGGGGGGPASGGGAGAGGAGSGGSEAGTSGTGGSGDG